MDGAALHATGPGRGARGLRGCRRWPRGDGIRLPTRRGAGCGQRHGARPAGYGPAGPQRSAEAPPALPRLLVPPEPPGRPLSPETPASAGIFTLPPRTCPGGVGRGAPRAAD
ncbi:hypothetical protein GCM10010211_50360 [Streptomyces albospinus]|uniref:Uncharacterized protein n=1 Tax=Streptomyces albospinus TaxID=285515 RepID=A0ABQ2VBR6_9ACTN|nr:hypothetical protein GCM10010211_50360 [Streptomyces albospinus]